MAAHSAPLRVAVIGGYFSANKGGAAMTQAVVDRVPERLGPCTFTVLSLYPEADRELGLPATVEVVRWKPVDLLVALPLALLAAVAGVLRLPRGPLLRTAGLRALGEADVVVDVAGISFVDGRGIPILGYNTLLTGIPLLLGARVVKASQALGPFETTPNRLAAKLVLPRLARVCARGERTESHVRELGLTNVARAADLAFILRTPPDAVRRATELIAADDERPVVIATPSSVVDAYCSGRGIDYASTMAALLRTAITEHGHRVLVVAHSTHPDDVTGRMHDLPICRKVTDLVGDPGCRLIDARPPTQVLRALVDQADLLVTSRFHAMISGLATATPTLVVGWSHKYAEVLREFDLEQFAVDYGDLAGEGLAKRFAELVANADDIRRRIRDRLPAVEQDSLRNIDAVATAVGR